MIIHELTHNMDRQPIQCLNVLCVGPFPEHSEPLAVGPDCGRGFLMFTHQLPGKETGAFVNYVLGKEWIMDTTKWLPFFLCAAFIAGGFAGFDMVMVGAGFAVFVFLASRFFVKPQDPED